MAGRTWWETLEAKGGEALEQLKRLVDEGNIRRVRVRQKDRTVAEFPLTVGVVGAVLAPPLAAIGAVVALITDCTIDIERTDDKAGTPGPSEDAGVAGPVTSD
jgi:hypothetical protein